MNEESFQTPSRIPREERPPPPVQRRTRFQEQEDDDQEVRRRLMGIPIRLVFPADPEFQTPVKRKTESKFSPSKKQKLFK